jgi:hypothetical protein
MVQVTNLTARPVLLTLTSGATLRLSPGATSPALRDVEIVNNAKIAKLQDQHMIAVVSTEAEKASTGDVEDSRRGARAIKKGNPGSEQ